MTNELHQYCEVVKNNKESMEDLLLSMSYFDMDFTGENGDEYLWEEAREAGFESNALYCLSIAKQEKDAENMAYTFLSMWMQHDCNYYIEYDISIRSVDNYIFVALSYIA